MNENGLLTPLEAGTKITPNIWDYFLLRNRILVNLILSLLSINCYINQSRF